MCDRCDWTMFVADCMSLEDRANDLPDRAADFADGVVVKLTSMRRWATDNEHVTDRMLVAIENIESGISRWER